MVTMGLGKQKILVNDDDEDGDGDDDFVVKPGFIYNNSPKG